MPEVAGAAEIRRTLGGAITRRDRGIPVLIDRRNPTWLRLEYATLRIDERNAFAAKDEAGLQFVRRQAHECIKITFIHVRPDLVSLREVVQRFRDASQPNAR